MRLSLLMTLGATIASFLLPAEIFAASRDGLPTSAPTFGMPSAAPGRISVPRAYADPGRVEPSTQPTQPADGRLDLHDLVTAPEASSVPDLAPQRPDPAIARGMSTAPEDSAGLSPMEIGLAVLAVVGAGLAAVIAWRRRV